MKKIMILGASILQLPAYLEAKKMGVYTIAIDFDKNAVGFQHCDKSYLVSTIDTDSIIKIAKQEKIDGIITLASDMPIRSVAKVCEEMDLNGIDVETAFKTTDKFAMREALSLHNVPIPKYYIADDYKAYLDAVSKFDKECIVKPTDNSGSRGIFVITDISNSEMINTAYEYSKKYSRSGRVLVEEYMHGDEVSVESFTINEETSVIQITNKLTSGIPYFVEIGHSQPCKQSKETIDRIIDVTKKAIRALGINNSPSHTEIKITEAGPKIVEIGARLGGGNITTHLVPLSTGVNMVANAINLALNQKTDICSKFSKGSAILFFYSIKEGIIKDICFDRTFLQDEDVVEVCFQKKEGDIVHELINGTERFGFVITKGKTEREALMKCYEVFNKIKVEII